MSNRQPCFDLVKMAMMLWVVWGHLGLYGIVEAEPLTYIHNAKIGVNMPVFFVMSGYFAASTFDRSNWCKILARTMSYVWPHITLPILCLSCWFFFSDDGMRTLLGRLPFYWFLRTLAIIYLLCAVMYRFATTNKARWVFFVIVYLVMFFCPQIFHWWWCDQVIHMFPYFVFGLMVLKNRPLHMSAKVSIACGVVFLLFVFLQGDSASNGMNFWKVCPYWNVVLFSLHDSVAFFARTIVGIAGSIFVLFLADRISRRLRFAGKLCSLGRTSLGVYVIHEYPLQMIGAMLTSAMAPAWSRWIVAVCWFLACHFAVRLIQYFKISRFLFFGDEAWMQNILTKFSTRFCAQ